MHWEIRKDRQGNDYYSFYYYDRTDKKNKRVPKSQTVHIRNDKEAEEFLNLKQAALETTKAKLLEVRSWKKKFIKEAEFLEIYKADRKKEAPNSWQNHVYYLELYVYDFFLNKSKIGNLGEWPAHFEKFKEYLETVKSYRGSRDLAYNTKNHIIVALNTFLKTMYKKGKGPKPEYMDLFPRHLTNHRTIADIYLDDELDKMRSYFKKEESTSNYDFFLLLEETGMRLNEAIGLSLKDLLSGSPKQTTFGKALERHGIKCLAYIFLRTQPSLDEVRDERERIPRKDLKGKHKKRDEDKARFIPISNKVLYNILAGRHKKQKALRKATKYGTDEADYLLFDDVDARRFVKAVENACKTLKIKHRSPHCLRHTFATKLAGLTLGDNFVCGQILGHTKSETTENYLHLNGLLEQAHVRHKLAVGDDDFKPLD